MEMMQYNYTPHRIPLSDNDTKRHACRLLNDGVTVDLHVCKELTCNNLLTDILSSGITCKKCITAVRASVVTFTSHQYISSSIGWQSINGSDSRSPDSPFNR